MKKTAKIVILSIVVVSLLVAAFLGFMAWRQGTLLQGKLVFAKSYDAGSKVNHITITNKEGTIELEQVEGYWRLPKYNGYYADFGVVKNFFDNLNSSAYLVKIPDGDKKLADFLLLNPLDNSENFGTGTLIQTYADDVLLDSVVVGMRDVEKGYFLARHADSDNVWLVGGSYDFPSEVKMWLPSPILEIPLSAVEMLGVDGNLISRRMSIEDFHDRLGLSVNVSWLFHNLSSLDVYGVMPEDEFVAKYSDAKLAKIYDISTFYGLRFELDFYKTEDNQVWLNIKLSTDSIALSAIDDYIKDNLFLYEGWYFQISPRQRDYLMGYTLL